MRETPIGLDEESFGRVAEATRWVESKRDAPPETEGEGKKGSSGLAWGEMRWVIVREIPSDSALWLWVEPAKPAENYADPGHEDYGLYVGIGPPPEEPEQLPGESNEDWEKRKNGWRKFAVWPHMLARDYALSVWPGTTTTETDVNVATRVRGTWHVKPPVERVETLMLAPGTDIGGCRPARMPQE